MVTVAIDKTKLETILKMSSLTGDSVLKNITLKLVNGMEQTATNLLQGRIEVAAKDPGDKVIMKHEFSGFEISNNKPANAPDGAFELLTVDAQKLQSYLGLYPGKIQLRTVPETGDLELSSLSEEGTKDTVTIPSIVSGSHQFLEPFPVMMNENGVAMFKKGTITPDCMYQGSASIFREIVKRAELAKAPTPRIYYLDLQPDSDPNLGTIASFVGSKTEKADSIFSVFPKQHIEGNMASVHYAGGFAEVMSVLGDEPINMYCMSGTPAWIVKKTDWYTARYFLSPAIVKKK